MEYKNNLKVFWAGCWITLGVGLIAFGIFRINTPPQWYTPFGGAGWIFFGIGIIIYKLENITTGPKI